MGSLRSIDVRTARIWRNCAPMRQTCRCATWTKGLANLPFLGIVAAMSVRMKLTHSKTASRRAHHRAGRPRLVATPSGTRRRHFVDPNTGMYRGKQIIAVGTNESETVKKPAEKKKAAPAKKEKAKKEEQ